MLNIALNAFLLCLCLICQIEAMFKPWKVEGINSPIVSQPNCPAPFGGQAVNIPRIESKRGRQKTAVKEGLTCRSVVLHMISTPSFRRAPRCAGGLLAPHWSYAVYDVLFSCGHTGGWVGARLRPALLHGICMKGLRSLF